MSETLAADSAGAMPGQGERHFALGTDEGRTLALLYALPGGLAGFVLYLVMQYAPGGEDPWLAFFGPLLVFGTGAWALATEPEERGRTALFAILLGAMLGGLAWSAYTFFGEEGAAHAAIATPVMGWIALAFYRARQGLRDGAYPEIFAQAWNLPVLLFVAQLFTWGTYGVLWLLAAMFRLIGIPVLTDVLAEPWFSLPVIGVLMACGIAVTRRQETILLSLRAVLFGLLRVVAPVFAFGTLVFSFALLFQGLDTLWEGWSPVILLVSTLTAGVVFINAVIQDHEGPGGALGITARVQAALLPVLGGLAAYGMLVRIGDHGLTPQRIVAAIITAFALAYALTYAVAGVTNRWAVLRRGNIVLAGALALVMAYTLTPLFRAQSWSAADQIARLEAGEVSAEEFDYAALRFDFGAPGQRALERLAAGDDAVAAARAQAVLDATHRWNLASSEAAARDASYDPNAPGAATIRPSGTALPESLVAEIRNNGALRPDQDTVFLVMPDYDGRSDAVLSLTRRDAFIGIRLWTERTEADPKGAAAWLSRAFYDRGFHNEEEAAAFMDDAKTATFGPEPVTVIVPRIGERTLRDERYHVPFIEPALPQTED